MKRYINICLSIIPAIVALALSSCVKEKSVTGFHPELKILTDPVWAGDDFRMQVSSNTGSFVIKSFFIGSEDGTSDYDGLSSYNRFQFEPAFKAGDQFRPGSGVQEFIAAQVDIPDNMAHIGYVRLELQDPLTGSVVMLRGTYHANPSQGIIMQVGSSPESTSMSGTTDILADTDDLYFRLYNKEKNKREITVTGIDSETSDWLDLDQAELLISGTPSGRKSIAVGDKFEFDANGAITWKLPKEAIHITSDNTRSVSFTVSDATSKEPVTCSASVVCHKEFDLVANMSYNAEKEELLLSLKTGARESKPSYRLSSMRIADGSLGITYGNISIVGSSREELLGNLRFCRTEGENEIELSEGAELFPSKEAGKDFWSAVYTLSGVRFTSSGFFRLSLVFYDSSLDKTYEPLFVSVAVGTNPIPEMIQIVPRNDNGTIDWMVDENSIYSANRSENSHFNFFATPSYQDGTDIGKVRGLFEIPFRIVNKYGNPVPKSSLSKLTVSVIQKGNRLVYKDGTAAGSIPERIDYFSQPPVSL